MNKVARIREVSEKGKWEFNHKVLDCETVWYITNTRSKWPKLSRSKKLWAVMARCWFSSRTLKPSGMMVGFEEGNRKFCTKHWEIWVTDYIMTTKNGRSEIAGSINFGNEGILYEMERSNCVEVRRMSSDSVESLCVGECSLLQKECPCRSCVQVQEEAKVCVCSRGCDKDRMPPKKLGKVGS